MRRWLVPTLVSIVCFCCVPARAQDKRHANSPPLPSPYRDYMDLPGGDSPDGRYGLIYPHRAFVDGAVEARLFLVAWRPFRVLTEVPLRYSSLFHGHNRYVVAWAKDHSAVVINEEIKWGPDKVFLVPVRKGHAGRIVDLTAAVEKLVRPAYGRTCHDPFNDQTAFIFLSEYGRVVGGQYQITKEAWEPNEHGQVAISCFCTNDPKDLAEHSWTVRFDGTWDVARGGFGRHTLTELPSGPGKNAPEH